MSSRRSSRSLDNESDRELILECKAAFLCIYDDIDDKIESKKGLNSLLQQTGRNPTKRALAKYWSEDTEELSFNDFVDICRKEAVTSADDLMKAFRKIDINGDGYLSLDELYKIMNKESEGEMTRDEVRRMIDEVDDNKDGKLDYREFTNMVMKTAEDAKKFSMKVMERKERKKKSGGRGKGLETPKQRPGSASSQRSQKQEDQKPSNSKARPPSAKSKESPRRDSKADLPPKPETPKQKEPSEKPGTQKTESDKSSNGQKPGTKQEKEVFFKINIPQDSARSVEEDYDDDFDIVSTGRPTPRIDLGSSLSNTPRNSTSRSEKASGSKASLAETKGDNNMGSQSSIKSGDKQLSSAPVPSPRKIAPRASEEEVPRPSPRVRSGSKTKSPSSRSKESLPNPKLLTDWFHSTSKGCFFYEEDEINTHVYSLSLQETSTVYLSAHPIQEPACLNLPSSEPIDTALFIMNERGKLVTFTEQRDTSGTYGVKCKLNAGEYQIVPYTTGCRFRQRKEGSSQHMKEAKLVKKDKDDNIKITSAFRKALEDIFELCDLDDNGTMSKDEFNWFNLRTSGEELGEDEWEVVEERTELKDGEITKAGFIALNEMEAEDAGGDVEDLWITLSSMGMNKSLMMDEACPFRVDVYVERYGRQEPKLSVSGIESLEKKEYVSEICASIQENGEPTKIKGMKDLYLYTYKSDQRATLVIDNRSRSAVNVAIDCSKSKNVTSNREALNHVFEIDPQETAIAHHLLPRDELADWSVTSVESIQ